MTATTYLDVEATLSTIFINDATFGLSFAGTELPDNLGTRLPALRIARVGGADAKITLDEATVVIDAFASDSTAAFTLAEQVRTFMRYSMRHRVVLGGSYNGVQTISAPSWAPWDNTTIRRYTATYRVFTHSA